MTQSSVGVSVSSVLIVVALVSSVLEPSLARFPPPRRFLAVLLSRVGDASPFSNGPSSISDGDPLDELAMGDGRGRRDCGIGRL